VNVLILVALTTLLGGIGYLILTQRALKKSLDYLNLLYLPSLHSEIKSLKALGK
jgi:hypothetical protein